ncbi:NAD(P)/FAD-dependent oxidoreductase [Nitrogeniibacter aestuarii]|uniref:NAD(P)/FAD-dependent oxidoreductase n=1 Tax=Nitrogeniibacter aestuarii TaxID=2815343 RepID=UPI001E57C47D|nr:FAD-dependent oxidoreductase [Nitrogeniibacter aestuarii]
MKYVLIGAGPAGVRAAETLRQQDPTGEITLVSGEPGEPYARMAIPYILNGDIQESGAHQRKTAGHFDELRVKYLNNKALQVHAGPDGGTVDLDDGTVLDYDRLLVATGSSPSLPPLPGTDLPGVVTCWTLDDARTIAAKLAPGTRVTIIGAGFVAGVCMKSFLQRGVDLTVIAGRAGQILRTMMTPTGSAMIQRWLESKGVNVITKGKTERIEPGPKLVMDNQTIESDLIILATGVKPNVSFLEGTGANIDQGIVVDEYMQTSVPHIYAAGDVAQGRDFSTGGWVVHALQPTSTEHGRVAAMNMAGRKLPYRGSLSMNVLDTAGLISHTFGIWQGVEGGEMVETVDEERNLYTRLCFNDDRMIGAITIGKPNHVGAIRGLIQTRRKLGEWKDKLSKNPSLVMEAFVALGH